MRVSHVGGRGGDSFHADADQVSDIERYAAARGAEVEFMVPELSVSGGKAIADRPSLQMAIEGVEAGRFDGIVVAYLSRLSRSRSGIEIWDRVEKAGGHVHCAAENLDTSTPSGRFIRDVHLANAVREREEHVDRFEMRTAKATEAGVWQRRQTPIGYRKDPETRRLVPSELAPLVRKAFADRASGHSVSAIARDLEMTPSGARNALSNRVYLGELRVRSYVNPAAHPPLVDEGVFAAAQLSQPRPPRSKVLEPSLLAGLVRCCGCGHMMPRGGGGNQRPTYTCARHHSGTWCPEGAAIACHLLDEYVQQVALRELASIRVQKTDGSTEAQRHTLASAERELAAYLEGVSAAGLPAGSFAEGARARSAAVEDAQRALAEALGAASYAPMIQGAVDAWPALDFGERNVVLRGVLDAVLVERVGRGRRVDVADRVRVVKAGSGLDLPRRQRGVAMGLHPLPFLDADDPRVLRVLRR